MNGHDSQAELGHIRKPSIAFSDQDGDENDDEEYQEGDYSTRMEELFEDGDEEGGLEDDEDEEGFVYTGLDADESTGDYRSQLRDVLGPDHEEDEELEELEVEKSLLHEVNDEKVDFSPDDAQVCVAHVMHVMRCEGSL